MGRKKQPVDEGPSVVDLLNNAFQMDEEDFANETIEERCRRLGRKLPPPNNPTTPEGRKWIKENCTPIKRSDRVNRPSKKKRPR